jgi:hypothetical protein
MKPSYFFLGLALPWASLLAQSVTITNLTRGNNAYYELGDSLKINITGGLASAAVTYTQIVNGISSGPFSIGNTDSSGNYQFGPATVTGGVGTWSETWYVGGVPASPTLSFTFLGPPTVSLTNNTRGGSVFYVGDSLTLNLAGGYPSSSATYDLTLNNAYQGNWSGGTTDTTGALVITGTIPSNPGDTGTNAQTWSVAGIQASSQPLNFSVTLGCQVGLINYPGNPPRFFFDTTYWYYSGSMSTTGITAAVSAWNADSSGTGITLANDPTGSNASIDIYDDSTIAPALGQTQSYNFYNGSSACYDHPSYSCSGLCSNASKVYVVGIQLNPGGISSTATTWGISLSSELKFVTSHELGHAFGLDD